MIEKGICKKNKVSNECKWKVYKYPCWFDKHLPEEVDEKILHGHTIWLVHLVTQVYLKQGSKKK